MTYFGNGWQGDNTVYYWPYKLPRLCWANREHNINEEDKHSGFVFLRNESEKNRSVYQTFWISRNPFCLNFSRAYPFVLLLFCCTLLNLKLHQITLFGSLFLFVGRSHLLSPCECNHQVLHQRNLSCFLENKDGNSSWKLAPPNEKLEESPRVERDISTFLWMCVLKTNWKMSQSGIGSMAASSVNMFMGAFKINWPDPECTITWNGHQCYCRREHGREEQGGTSGKYQRVHWMAVKFLFWIQGNHVNWFGERMAPLFDFV